MQRRARFRPHNSRAHDEAGCPGQRYTEFTSNGCPLSRDSSHPSSVYVYRGSALAFPGENLASCRPAQQVVAKLAINPNTVLKAYRDLEREGLVRGRLCAHAGVCFWRVHRSLT
jgi:hypothetical protein